MKNIITKFLFLWIFLLGTLLGLRAQVMPFSQVVRHNNIKGEEVITRALPGNEMLTCSKAIDGGVTHTFTRYSPTGGGTKQFTCNLGTLFTLSQDVYSIKDMYIFENKCFFCGYYIPSNIAPAYDNWGAILHVTTHGFVGYFDLREMTVSPTGSGIFMMDLPMTDSIVQLVAHHDDNQSYDMFIMAVGYSSIYSLSTCVVELTNPVGGGLYDTLWTLNVVQPTCAEMDEYMTDIVLTNDHVVVASKLPYADGSLDGDTDETHYLFRLHEAKRAGFYRTIVPPASSASVYQYDVSSYGVGIGCHHIGDPIRLCPMDGNRFCVYYQVERREPPMYNGVGGSYLFWMNESQLMEHAARTYGLFNRTKEAAWVGDAYRTIAVLQSDDSYQPEGIVYFPTMHPTPSANGDGPCLAQRIQGVDLHSIDCNPASQYLYIGGTYHDKKLCHGIQKELSYCDSVPSTPCIDRYSNQFDTMATLEPTEEYCIWTLTYSNSNYKARKATFRTESGAAEEICTNQ